MLVIIMKVIPVDPKVVLSSNMYYLGLDPYNS